MDTVTTLIASRKYGVIIIVLAVVVFILYDKLHFTDIDKPKQFIINFPKKRMFNVLPDDVHKNMLKKIENGEHISFINGYDLEYIEGLDKEIPKDTLLYFPYDNKELLYFKEDTNTCYYPEKNSLLIIDKPIEIVTNDNLNNFKVIIGKNNITIN
jgi:hypothetical protein